MKSLAEVKALSDPLRQRMLACFAEHACTPKQVAEALSEKATSLYYHVRVLRRAGLIRVVSTRRKRGTLEHHYAAVARRFALAGDALTPGSGGTRGESPAQALFARAFDATLEEMRAGLQDRREGGRHRGAGQSHARARKVMLARVRIHGTRAEIESIRKQLERLLSRHRRRGRGASEEYGITVAFYPVASAVGTMAKVGRNK